MSCIHWPMRLAVLAFTFAGPAFAQDATTPTADCEAQFTALDTDGNGSLSETEAAQVYARARVDNMAIAASGYTREEFLQSCADMRYARTEPEAGAPFEGANSFTEGQAADRAVAWGLSGVSALTKDDKGIWRGTATLDGASVSVAVDYKGNVVTTAQ